MIKEHIYYTEDGLEFLIHCWEGEMYFDVDYKDNLLLIQCKGDYHVIMAGG